MVVQTATVIINIVLAPALMFGWLGTAPMGVAGAGPRIVHRDYHRHDLAGVLFLRSDVVPEAASALPAARRHVGAVLKIGLPAGVEFAFIAVYLFVVYTVSRPFGAAAQAGFGIGQRIIQAGFMPIVALGFAVGAGRRDRISARAKPTGCAKHSSARC